jgi:hypothetical protein
VTQCDQVKEGIKDGHAENTRPSHGSRGQEQFVVTAVVVAWTVAVVDSIVVVSHEHQPALANGKLGNGRNTRRHKAKQNANLPRRPIFYVLWFVH